MKFVLFVVLACLVGVDVEAAQRPLSAGVRWHTYAHSSGDVYRVQVAPGGAVHLLFPAGLAGEPHCTDTCIEESTSTAAKGGRFRFRSVGTPGVGTVVVGWSGPPTERASALLSVAVVGRSQPLSIELRLARAEDGDTQVSFTPADAVPADVQVEKRVAELRAADANEFAKRLRDASARALHEQVLQTHQCSRVGARERKADAIFEVEEICHFGRKHFLTFSLTNRGSATLFPGTVLVTLGSGAAAMPVDYLSLPYFSKEGAEESGLLHKESVRGVVSFEVDDEEKARRFEVRWNEVRGANRQLVVPDVSF
ncbi:hypothetical protein FJV41_23925 [Myxococcus llanfairpwllgwyngyllgogerychwyrndrobwllllantysiliogogogochensis]|uniref:Uncharacterized protein n=1 Tax=Myxococcus llanfairpwllgwyngyllgogerychwyrndrobwllllantysiliogogogochensis TaxID=2590453 RepID=A0A540WWQ0_9BACT|nr:hypothetical protein [Myxococcus llanfairpwllgwyngyllgogerychwyrndrobwllllantysiliogogogochensis]TQF13441.1 hypothetical protein FJV41_23925 [Myxococcus llanfairpwllgwyngyllgogerychwyrndrobwllllantysiliogogogochensis]